MGKSNLREDLGEFISITVNKTEFLSSKTFIACMIVKTSAGDGIAKIV